MTIRHPTFERIGEDYHQAIHIPADCNTESEVIGYTFKRIECQLEYALLEDAPEFAALSYVWGDPNDTIEITLNGAEFPVTRNLYKALTFLTRVHNDGEKMRYWIDAMCINQNDVQERSGQVLRMRDIYGSAKLVFAFLGDLGSQLIPFINMIPTLGNQMFANLEKRLDLLDDYSLLYERGENYLALYEVVTGILMTPWFGRAWVVQEAVTPLISPFLILGHQILRLEDLAIVETALNLPQMRSKLPLGPASIIRKRLARNLVKLRDLYHPDPKDVPSSFQITSIDSATLKLSHLLKAVAAQKQATDPRDKIFSFIGLVPQMDYSGSLRPDYTSSCSKVYHQYTQFILETIGDLDILLTKKHHVPGVPSWVSDFGNALEDHMFSDTKVGTPVVISVDETRLKIQGTILGFLDVVWQSNLSRIKAKSSEKLAQFHETIVQKASYLRGDSSFDMVLDEWLKRNYASDQLQQSKAFYHRILRGFLDSSDPTLTVDEEVFKLFGPILLQTYVVLKDGAIGYIIGEELPRVGDMACIARGLKIGFILRKNGGYWEYICACDLLHRPLAEQQWLLKNTPRKFTII